MRYRTIGIAIAATIVALAASLLGAFGPDMQLGVKRQYFVCAGTSHGNQYPGPDPVAIEDATLSLELWRFPVTLWAGKDDGDATFTTREMQTYYDRVAELDDLVQISSAHANNKLGMLNTISGSLQISEYGNDYDLECRSTRP